MAVSDVCAVRRKASILFGCARAASDAAAGQHYLWAHAYKVQSMPVRHDGDDNNPPLAAVGIPGFNFVSSLPEIVKARGGIRP